MANETTPIGGSMNENSKSAAGGEGGDRILPDAAQGQIAKQLQEAYGKLLTEPLPETFSVLLQKLSKPEGQ